jgi:hypothetical protein
MKTETSEIKGLNYEAETSVINGLNYEDRDFSN